MISFQKIKHVTLAILVGLVVTGCGVSISRGPSDSSSCVCKGCAPEECAQCPHCSAGKSCAGSCEGADKHGDKSACSDAEKPAKGGCFGSQGTCKSGSCGHQH